MLKSIREFSLSCFGQSDGFCNRVSSAARNKFRGLQKISTDFHHFRFLHEQCSVVCSKVLMPQHLDQFIEADFSVSVVVGQSKDGLDLLVREGNGGSTETGGQLL